jgi:hypothetical protein
MSAKSPRPPPLPPVPEEVREEDYSTRRRLRGATLLSGSGSQGTQATVGSTFIG